MGIYFVSSVLLLRMTMPPAYRNTITAMLGNAHIPLFHRLFDWVFLGAVFVFGGYQVLQELERFRSTKDDLAIMNAGRSGKDYSKTD